MIENLDIVVMIPIGPKYNQDYGNDTIASINYYLHGSAYIILLVNDSGDPDFHRNMGQGSNVVIYDVAADQRRDQRRITFGQLFAKQMAALKQLTKKYNWQCLLRMDDDSLVIGPNPQAEALAAFAADPRIGMLGAYRYRGDGSNKEKAMARKGRLLVLHTLSIIGFRGVARSVYLAQLIFRALRHGYRLGDMCTGGGLFISRAAYDDMAQLYDSKYDLFTDCKLDDDLLFALHVAASGRVLEDFSGHDQIMAINWRGLPVSLVESVVRHKKVIHPVKEPGNPDHEPMVRLFFSQLRK